MKRISKITRKYVLWPLKLTSQEDSTGKRVKSLTKVIPIFVVILLCYNIWGSRRGERSILKDYQESNHHNFTVKYEKFDVQKTKQHTVTKQKVTLVLMSYSTKRLQNIERVLQEYQKMTEVIDAIVFVWNNVEELPPLVVLKDLWDNLETLPSPPPRYVQGTERKHNGCFISAN